MKKIKLNIKWRKKTIILVVFMIITLMIVSYVIGYGMGITLLRKGVTI